MYPKRFRYQQTYSHIAVCMRYIFLTRPPGTKGTFVGLVTSLSPASMAKECATSPWNICTAPCPLHPPFSVVEKKILTKCQKTHNFSNFPFEFQLNIFKLFYLSFKSCNASMGNHYVHVACTI